MQVKVGTFNLNNLFSRFNFKASITAPPRAPADAVMTFDLSDPEAFRVRKFQGRLIEAKDPDDTAAIATRIRDAMAVDVLAVQEVENIDILKRFNRVQLDGYFRHAILIEGNDPRFIDVGVLSRLPIGAVTSFQTAVHPDDPAKTVFSRDLLEVEVLNESRSRKLFTLYNTHLKSHFGDDDDGGAGRARNDQRRRRQAEAVAAIVAARQRTNARFIVTGDMNDGPEAEPLAALHEIEGNAMLNAMATAQETRPAKAESSGHDPATAAWTHRFKPTGQPPEHRLFDQIWLSAAMDGTLREAWIDRRTKHGGDGSDHDPAWVVLEL